MKPISSKLCKNLIADKIYQIQPCYRRKLEKLRVKWLHAFSEYYLGRLMYT